MDYAEFQNTKSKVVSLENNFQMNQAYSVQSTRLGSGI